MYILLIVVAVVGVGIVVTLAHAFPEIVRGLDACRIFSPAACAHRWILNRLSNHLKSILATPPPPLVTW